MDTETALIASQRTLFLGEIDLDDDIEVDQHDAVPGGDLAMNVPLEKFFRDRCVQLDNMDGVMKEISTWCDFHMEKGGCDGVDPTMVKHLGVFIGLKKTLMNATTHARQWVQDGEGLKQRWSAAAVAMKKRQYTMSLQACPEKNPDDSDDYMLAIANINDWEQSKLDAHQRESSRLDDMVEEAKVNMNKHLFMIGKEVGDWIHAHYKGGVHPIGADDMEGVDADMIAELESIVGRGSRRDTEAGVFQHDCLAYLLI